jgi:biotin transport system substrate-specific component
MSTTFEHRDDSIRMKKMVLAALFAALIAVGAYIKIPIGPIPITLQTFFVLLAAVTLGRNWGTISVIVYTLVGFIGLPVFAGGAAGIGVLFGPTAGYLYSFTIVAFVVGWLSDIWKNTPKKYSVKNVMMSHVVMFGLAVLGSVIILGVGTLHLAFASNLPLQSAFVAGFVPFFAGDMIKSVAIGIFAPLFIHKMNFKAD